jgi:DNA-binding NtrC family response regulator
MIAGKFGHILLFEYQTGLRQLIRETFEDLGYRVSSPVSASAARDSVARGDVDLLVADIHSAGGEEYDTAKYAVSAGLPCVLMSHVKEVRRSLGTDGAIFVDESFTLEQLSDKVTEVLMSCN